MRVWLAALLFLAVSLPARAQTSVGAERASREIEREIEMRWPRVDDPTMLDRLHRIIDRICAVVGRDGWSWSPRVIANQTPNAFVLPNGDIYVHQGLLEALPTEGPIGDDELAFVVAHEMMHVLLEHSSRQSDASAGVGRVLARTGVTRTPGGAILSRILRQGINASQSRSLETEADRAALTCIAQAGYAPEAALTLLARLRRYEEEQGTPLRILRTHPRPAEREANVQTWLSERPSGRLGTIDTSPSPSLPITLVALSQADGAPSIALDRVVPRLTFLLGITNLVTLPATASPLDRAALDQAAQQRGADMVVLLVVEGIDQKRMPWPGGLVCTVDVRITARLLAAHGGHEQPPVSLHATREATLTVQSGRTRDDVVNEALEQALFALEAPLTRALRPFRRPSPAPNPS